MNEPINEIAGALVKAQSELKNPKLDATNPHFRSKFASLACVRDTVTPVFTKHGIAIIQNLVTNEQGVGCETILVHVSGQTLRLGPLFLPAAKHDPQGFGSCATYARRYALMAAANVVGDEDDDANEGTRTHNERPTQTRSAGRSPSAPSEPVIPAGKHAGTPWSKATTLYLQAVLDSEDAPTEMKDGAQRELDRRDAKRTAA